MAEIQKRTLRPGERARILIVDGSAAVRRQITRLLAADTLLEVAGSAATCSIALHAIPQLNPDLLILDLELPDGGGLETLRRVRADFPTLPIVVFGTAGPAAAIQARSLGAEDYISVPPGQSLPQLLLPGVRRFFAPCAPDATSAGASLNPAVLTPRILAIGASTGGPIALAALLGALPVAFPLPVLVVQHMPPPFTRLLAERLAPVCPLPVREARHGDPVSTGCVLIAPGDFHMRVTGAGPRVHIALDQSPPLNSCRPAVDALFASIADVYGGASIAVILTGMGHDGLRGARLLEARAATVLAQDQASSVVWGMPGAVAEAGLAASVLPLPQIAPRILEQLAFHQSMEKSK